MDVYGYCLWTPATPAYCLAAKIGTVLVLPWTNSFIRNSTILAKNKSYKLKLF